MDVGTSYGLKVLGSFAKLEAAKADLLVKVASSILAAGCKAAADSSLTTKEIMERVDKATAILRNDTKAPDVARSEYSIAFDGKYSKLEQRPGIHGKLELRFTLKGGLRNLYAACDEISQSIKSAKNYPKKEFKICLSTSSDPNFSKNKDIIVEFTPVLYNSGGRKRYGKSPACSPGALAKSTGLKEDLDNIVRLAAGAFRKQAGFPEKREDIGTSEDEGDIFEGKYVRIDKEDSNPDILMSCPDGVRSFENGSAALYDTYSWGAKRLAPY